MAGTEEGRQLGRETLKIHILGLEQLVRNVSKLSDGIVEAVVTAAEVGQARVINSARRIVPVKTGALQASIGAGRVLVTDKQVQAEIVAAMKYASYVEKRKPYLGPALLENNNGFVKSINAAVRARIRQAAVS